MRKRLSIGMAIMSTVALVPGLGGCAQSEASGASTSDRTSGADLTFDDIDRMREVRHEKMSGGRDGGHKRK